MWREKFENKIRILVSIRVAILLRFQIFAKCERFYLIFREISRKLRKKKIAISWEMCKKPPYHGKCAMRKGLYFHENCYNLDITMVINGFVSKIGTFLITKSSELRNAFSDGTEMGLIFCKNHVQQIQIFASFLLYFWGIFLFQQLFGSISSVI